MLCPLMVFNVLFVQNKLRLFQLSMVFIVFFSFCRIFVWNWNDKTVNISNITFLSEIHSKMFYFLNSAVNLHFFVLFY